MKKLVITLLVVAVLLLALPGLLGKLAQNQLEDQLNLGEVNPVFAFSIADYDRGWFGSTVRYELGFSDEYMEMIENATAGDPASTSQGSLDDSLLNVLAPFEMESKISHGPIGFLNGPFFGLYKSATTESSNNPELAEFLGNASMPYLVNVHTTTSLLGNTKFNFELPASANTSSATTGDSLAGKLNFSGAKGNGSFSPGSKHIQLSSEMENLSIKDDGAELSLQGMSLDSDQTLIAGLGFSGIGAGKMTIASLTYNDPKRAADAAMSMQDMTFIMDSDYGTSNQTIDVKANYQISQLLTQDQTITDIEFTMTMRELSVSALQKYSDWSNNMTSLMTSTEPDNKDLYGQISEQLTPMVHEFASTSPQISFSPIKLTANDEKFLASLNINLDAETLPALATFEITDPAMWFGLLSGDAGLSLSEKMATLLAISSAQSQLQAAIGDQEGISPEQIQQMAIAQAPIVLQTLVQQGMLQQADGQIIAAIEFENGELLLNGKPIPIAMLLGL